MKSGTKKLMKGFQKMKVVGGMTSRREKYSRTKHAYDLKRLRASAGRGSARDIVKKY